MRSLTRIWLAGLAVGAVLHGAVIYTFSGTTLPVNTAEGTFPAQTVAFQYTSPGFIGANTLVPPSLLTGCQGCSATGGQIFAPRSINIDQLTFTDTNGVGYEFDFALGTLSTPGTFQTSLPPGAVGPINQGTLTIQVTGQLAAANSAGYLFCGPGAGVLCASNNLAPGEDASIFGSEDVANTVAQASGAAPSMNLGGYTVTVTDSSGAMRMALVSYVSPLQINFVVPPECVPGPATITVAGAGTQQSFAVNIANVAPGIFTANSNGAGVAAAQIVLAAADGSQTVEGAATWDATSQQWTAAPVALGTGAAYLVLYATGVRNHVSPVQVVYFTSSGEVELSAAYAGPQGQYEGLDQVNVLLPNSLSGSVSMWLDVDGAISNPVSLMFE